MKRFTLMLMAAFIAVVAFANGESKNNMPALQANAIVKPAKQIVPTKKLTQKIPNSANNLRARLEKASALSTKATRRAGIDDMVGKNYMLISDFLDLDEEEGLVNASPSAGGWSIQLSKEDASTIGIEGFTSDATEKLLATYSEDVDAELAEYGVIATISIEGGQVLYESSYGNVVLLNAADDEAPIEGYILSDGTILFTSYWYTALGDGDYAGYMWDEYIFSSSAVIANGEMTWGEESATVYIYQDEEDPEYVTVYNFSGYETAIDVEISYEGTFVIPSQLVKSYQSYGDFYTYGLSEDETALTALKGQVNRSSLDFNGKWIIYATSTGYSFGSQVPATISYTDGTRFIIPEAPQDIAAMPANPRIASIENTEYGWRITFTIPIVDTEGNEMLKSKLYYEIFTETDGEVAPLTFTPATHSKLTENLTLIPYGFTEDYDIYSNRIYLNDLYSENWDKIGIKSIYYGGNTTNETEIQWLDIEAFAGISAVKSEKAVDGAIYNMSGQRVSNNYKGLVIKNGKKYIAK